MSSSSWSNGSRRVLHCNVTDHPTAQWNLQQIREAIPSNHVYRFLIHDRDSIFSPHVDTSICNLGLTVLRTPCRSPRANALCERLIGTLRREALDWVIPITENPLRKVVNLWRVHYNRGRPHMTIGPGIPEPPAHLPVYSRLARHAIPIGLRVVTCPVLAALHHEYAFAPKAA